MKVGKRFDMVFIMQIQRTTNLRAAVERHL